MNLDELLAKAGAIVAGPELNARLSEIRDGIDGAIGYEMVLDDRTFEQLLHVELPKLTEHLVAKRVSMLGAPWVIITCWKNGNAHIFAGDVFFDAIAAGLEISTEELRARIVQWRREAGLD